MMNCIKKFVEGFKCGFARGYKKGYALATGAPNPDANVIQELVDSCENTVSFLDVFGSDEEEETC